MRGAHRVAGLALSLAMLGFGCGDDSVAVDAAVDANMADHPNVDHPNVDGTGNPDAGPSVTIAAVELHGTVTGPGGAPVPLMKAAVSVSTTPADFMPDFMSGSFPNSCTATAYDVTAGTPKFPPPTYDMGDVVVTMYTGQPLATLHATTTCAFNAAGYGCDFPDVSFGSGNYPEVDNTGASAPKHWIQPGDRLNFNIMGSSGISALNMRIPTGSEALDNFSATATAVQGTVMATGCSGGTAVELQGNTNGFAFGQDMLVKFNCGGQGCGLVAVSMSASDTANPGRGAGLTCTRLISAATDNCVRIPAGALQILHYNGWDTAAGAHIQTSVVHFGLGFTQTALGGTAGATIGAARGQFFIKVP